MQNQLNLEGVEQQRPPPAQTIRQPPPQQTEHGTGQARMSQREGPNPHEGQRVQCQIEGAVQQTTNGRSEVGEVAPARQQHRPEQVPDQRSHRQRQGGRMKDRERHPDL